MQITQTPLRSSSANLPAAPSVDNLIRMKARNLRKERQRERGLDDSHLGGDKKQTVRAIHGASDPAWHTGRDDNAGGMNLAHALPQTRGEALPHSIFGAAEL